MQIKNATFELAIAAHVCKQLPTSALLSTATEKNLQTIKHVCGVLAFSYTLSDASFFDERKAACLKKHSQAAKQPDRKLCD